MTESTPEALKTVAENLAQDVKKETPGVIQHLEAFLEWDKEAIEAAYKWLDDKVYPLIKDIQI